MEKYDTKMNGGRVYVRVVRNGENVRRKFGFWSPFHVLVHDVFGVERKALVGVDGDQDVANLRMCLCVCVCVCVSVYVCVVCVCVCVCARV
jgi:hypothetical protein